MTPEVLELFRHLGAVSCAAALALAAVLGLAAVIAALAAALSLAIVFAFTRVLVSCLIERSAAERRFAHLDYGVYGLRSSGLHRRSSTEQTGNCRSNHQGLHRMLHVVIPPCQAQTRHDVPVGGQAAVCEYASAIRLQHLRGVFV